MKSTEGGTRVGYRGHPGRGPSGFTGFRSTAPHIQRQSLLRRCHEQLSVEQRESWPSGKRLTRYSWGSSALSRQRPPGSCTHDTMSDANSGGKTSKAARTDDDEAPEASMEVVCLSRGIVARHMCVARPSIQTRTILPHQKEILPCWSNAALVLLLLAPASRLPPSRAPTRPKHTREA